MLSNISLHKRSILWLWVLGPDTIESSSGPLSFTMQFDTKTFSLALCNLALLGRPNLLTPFKKHVKTVEALLLLIHFFSIWVILSHCIYNSQDSKVKERPFLISLYHFHPICKQLDFSPVIIADSSTLYIARTGFEPITFSFQGQVANH